MKWLNRNLAALLSVVVFLELGERVAERFLPIYILAVGGSSFIVGFSSAIDNLLGALYSLPGGYLSDRIGYKKSLLIFDLVACLGYLIAILIPAWPAVVFGAMLFTSWSAVSLPAIMSAVSKNLPTQKRVLGVSMHSLIRRFPMALGPVICGYLVSRWGDRDGVRVAFLFALGITAFSVWVQTRWIRETHVASENKPNLNPWKLFKEMKPDLKRLLLSDILIRYCEQIPYAFVVIWCLKNVGVSPVNFGVLTSIEMVTAILVYLPVAALVEKVRLKKPFIAITFGFFSIFPLVLFYSRSFWWLAFAFLVRGLKEFGEPTRKSLILDFAQGEHQGTLFGVYYMFRDTVVALGALLGGVLWTISPQLNLFTAFGFGVLGTAYFIRYCRE